MTDIAFERKKLRDEGLEFITREQWRAEQRYTSPRNVHSSASQFFLHISVTRLLKDEAAGMRVIESIGQSRFGIGCSYNAAVFPSGRLYEAQPLTRRGAHTVNNFKRTRCPEHDTLLTAPSWNNNVTGRALVLPQNVLDDVTDAQIDSAARWAAAQIRSGLAVRTARWCGHRCVTAKDCPGAEGYSRIPELQKLTDKYVKTGLKQVVLPKPIPEKRDPMLDLVCFVEDDKDTVDPAYAVVRVDDNDSLRHVSGAEVTARRNAGGKVIFVTLPLSDDIWKLRKLS